MKSLVIYQSKTGFTEKYAHWIANELNSELTPMNQLTSDMMAHYDVVIFGSYIKAGKITGLKKLKTLLNDFPMPKLVVFATGATPFEAKEIHQTMWESNFTAQELSSVPHYYFPGGLNYEKMGIFDRFIMKMLAKMLSKQNSADAAVSAMSENIVHSHDRTSKDYVTPLVQTIKQMKL